MPSEESEYLRRCRDIMIAIRRLKPEDWEQFFPMFQQLHYESHKGKIAVEDFSVHDDLQCLVTRLFYWSLYHKDESQPQTRTLRGLQPFV